MKPPKQNPTHKRHKHILSKIKQKLIKHGQSIIKADTGHHW
jgi:hypothetical protein